MLTIGNIDSNKIITASIKTSQAPVDNTKNQRVKKEKNYNSGKTLFYTGASALASFAIAGIFIHRSRKYKNIKITPDNPFSARPGIISGNDIKMPSDKPEPRIGVKSEQQNIIINSIVPFDEKEESLRKNIENQLRNSISEEFRAYRDKQLELPEFKYRSDYVIYKFIDPVKPDLRELEKEDFQALMSFLKDYKYNAKLRAGIDLSDVEEIKRLDKLIEEAEPLEKEAIVYRGIRTQKIWDNFEDLDFAKQLDDGVILKDRAYPSTSRVYDDYLAQVDPCNYKGHEDCGYIMRITLPEGTKGIDCRRCTGKILDKGANAVYILPRNSNFLIQHVDDLHKIIYAKYLKP